MLLRGGKLPCRRLTHAVSISEVSEAFRHDRKHPCSDQGDLSNETARRRGGVAHVRMGGALTCEPDAWPRRANPPGLSLR